MCKVKSESDRKLMIGSLKFATPQLEKGVALVCLRIRACRFTAV
jgi:hypothetical protein